MFWGYAAGTAGGGWGGDGGGGGGCGGGGDAGLYWDYPLRERVADAARAMEGRARMIRQ